MRARRTTLLDAVLAVSACAGLTTSAFSQSPATETLPAVTFPLTRVHTVTSRINGRDYAISVALPSSYGENASDTTRFPVLYVMDNDDGGALRIVIPTFRASRGAANANVLLVGIAPVVNAAAGPVPPLGLRQIDYTPPAFPFSDSANARLQEGAPRAGGAATFLRILRDELIPFVERTYRTTPDRGLLGGSMAGQFAAYVLFEAPELFTRYALVSPSLWWDDGAIFRREIAFAKGNPVLPKTVYVSMGFDEWPEAISQAFHLVSVLCDGLKFGNRYQGLDVVAAVNMEDGHVSVVHFARALETLYPLQKNTRTAFDVARPARAFCGPRARW